MYSKEELSAKKYGDLLKILKKLGIKGGRLKTEKVIELILENQNDESELHTTISESKLLVEENQVEAVSSNTLVEDKTENVKEIQPSTKPSSRRKTIVSINRRVTRSSIANLSDSLIDDVDGHLKNDVEKKNSLNDESFLNLSNSFSRRSNTFVLEDGLPDDSLTTSLDLKASFNRSATFTLDEKKDTTVKLSQISPDKKMDLSCSEVQTVEDIESIETGRVKDAPPLTGSPSILGSKKKTMRRSLRGQLLESKMYLNGSFLTSLPEAEPVIPVKSKPIPEDKNLPVPESKNAPVKDDSTMAFTEDNVTVPKTFEFGKKTTSGDEKSSGIPRFVSYARKSKMPNFARIHENAFSKMEALDDYVERKHSRTKSMIETAAASLDEKEFKNFIEKRKPENSKLNLTDSKALQIVTNKRTATKTPSSVSKRRSSTFVIQTANTPPSTLKAKSSVQKAPPAGKPCALPRLVKENVPPKYNPFSWNKPQINENTPGSFQRRKSYVPTPPRSNLAAHKTKREVSHMVVSTKHGNALSSRRKSIEEKGLGRKEALKRAANRRPNVKSSAEIRASEKVFIKGVRTNRRFELQMANRGVGPN